MKVVVLIVIFILVWRWTCASPLPCGDSKCASGKHICKHMQPTDYIIDFLRSKRDPSFQKFTDSIKNAAYTVGKKLHIVSKREDSSKTNAEPQKQANIISLTNTSLENTSKINDSAHNVTEVFEKNNEAQNTTQTVNTVRRKRSISYFGYSAKKVQKNILQKRTSDVKNNTNENHNITTIKEDTLDIKNDNTGTQNLKRPIRQITVNTKNGTSESENITLVKRQTFDIKNNTNDAQNITVKRQTSEIQNGTQNSQSKTIVKRQILENINNASVIKEQSPDIKNKTQNQTGKRETLEYKNKTSGDQNIAEVLQISHIQNGTEEFKNKTITRTQTLDVNNITSGAQNILKINEETNESPNKTMVKRESLNIQNNDTDNQNITIKRRSLDNTNDTGSVQNIPKVKRQTSDFQTQKSENKTEKPENKTAAKREIMNNQNDTGDNKIMTKFKRQILNVNNNTANNDQKNATKVKRQTLKLDNGTDEAHNTTKMIRQTSDTKNDTEVQIKTVVKRQDVNIQNNTHETKNITKLKRQNSDNNNDTKEFQVTEVERNITDITNLTKVKTEANDTKNTADINNNKTFESTIIKRQIYFDTEENKNKTRVKRQPFNSNDSSPEFIPQMIVTIVTKCKEDIDSIKEIGQFNNKAQNNNQIKRQVSEEIKNDSSTDAIQNLNGIRQVRQLPEGEVNPINSSTGAQNIQVVEKKSNAEIVHEKENLITSNSTNTTLENPAILRKKREVQKSSKITHRGRHDDSKQKNQHTVHKNSNVTANAAKNKKVGPTSKADHGHHHGKRDILETQDVKKLQKSTNLTKIEQDVERNKSEISSKSKRDVFAVYQKTNNESAPDDAKDTRKKRETDSALLNQKSETYENASKTFFNTTETDNNLENIRNLTEFENNMTVADNQKLAPRNRRSVIANQSNDPIFYQKNSILYQNNQGIYKQLGDLRYLHYGKNGTRPHVHMSYLTRHLLASDKNSSLPEPNKNATKAASAFNITNSNKKNKTSPTESTSTRSKDKNSTNTILNKGITKVSKNLTGLNEKVAEQSEELKQTNKEEQVNSKNSNGLNLKSVKVKDEILTEKKETMNLSDSEDISISSKKSTNTDLLETKSDIKEHLVVKNVMPKEEDKNIKNVSNEKKLIRKRDTNALPQDEYFKYNVNDFQESEDKLEEDELRLITEISNYLEPLICTCAMYVNNQESKEKNPTFIKTILAHPLEDTNKELLCTESCSELAKVYFRSKKEIFCSHFVEDFKNHKEIVFPDQNRQDKSKIVCEVSTTENEQSLQFVLSWLHVVLLDVVVCLTGLGIVCIYLICHMTWRRRIAVPVYTTAPFVVK